jgi:predicted amidohydrolase
MQDLKVTLVQIDQVWEDKGANLQKYAEIFSQLEQTDLIVLPEMFQTGFSMRVNELAEEWNNSTGLIFLKHWSEKLNAAIYTSLIIQDRGNYYNRGVFVFPSGKLIYYDKRKSFALGGEDLYFKAGHEEIIVEYQNWKINLQICFDLRFPELVRNRLSRNNDAKYDVLIYVANWPERRSNHWNALLKARAIENQCYTIGVNRIGNDGNSLMYIGESQVIDMSGVLRDNLLNVEGHKSFVLNYSELESFRKQLPFLIHEPV